MLCETVIISRFSFILAYTATVREENGEFCVAVAPATRTAGILT